ncbi:MAG: hypothetical protein ACYC2H_02650 [Thermoplasmatota archaeon]
MPSLRVLLTSVAAILAVAVPASALPGLPVGLPSIEQQIDTPVGRIDAAASEQGIASCANLSTPAVPALPVLPALPVPVAVPSVPALPTPSAAAQACYGAGLDGAYADANVDAAGNHVATGIEAHSPVSEEQLDSTVDETAGQATGFLEGILDTLFGWI